MKREHIGSDFDGFLQEDGLLAGCEADALKRVVTWQIERKMKRRRISRANLPPPTTTSHRDSLFTKSPSDVLDHATSEITAGTKLGIDATKRIPGEGFKRPWPPLIKMDAAVKSKVENLFGGTSRR